jgi:hypothetical protein
LDRRGLKFGGRPDASALSPVLLLIGLVAAALNGWRKPSSP